MPTMDASSIDERQRPLADFTTDRRVWFLVGLSLFVGAVSALIAIALMDLIGFITNLVYYHRVSTALVSPDQNRLGWLSVPIPILGGLIVGLMARYGSEKIRGHGIPEALESILINGSRIEPKVAVLKPVSSAIAIGTGGPFGAEGPRIMTGGALGSRVGLFIHLSAAERKTLLVAGAAAGMATIFNAPIDAVLMAVELLLFEFKPRSLAPVMCATVTATILRRLVLGAAPIFALQAHAPSLPVTALWAIPIGVAGALLAFVLTLAVYGAEDAYRRLPIHWMWWPLIGGLIVGVGGLIEPRALGVGYDTIDAALGGKLALGALAGILIVKLAIWALSLSSGTSGGILAPVLLMGAALSGILGQALPRHSPGMWAFIMMAAGLAGVMRSPLTSVVFAYELTGATDLMVPLLAACAVAYLISVLILDRSILTEKIARRGLHLSREYQVDALEVLRVDEMAQPVALTVPADMPVNELRARLATASAEIRAQRLYPVVAASGKLVGVITRTDLAELPGDATEPARAAARPAIVAHPDDTLRWVAERMIAHNVWRLLVVAADDSGRVVGLITQRDLLRARERQLAEERHRERFLRMAGMRRASRPRARDGPPPGAGGSVPAGPAPDAAVKIGGGERAAGF